MRTGSKLILFFCLCLFLSGCSSDRQIESQMPVVMMGVDQDEKGGIAISAKVPLLGGKQSSGGGGGGGGGQESQSGGGKQEDEGYGLVEASGKDWSTALTALYSAMPRTLNFSQVREIVIGEQLAKSDQFMERYQSICSLSSIRSQAYIVICQGKAKEFLSKQQARVGSRLSKYIDDTFTHYQSMAYVSATTLGVGQVEMLGSSKDPLFIYGAVASSQKPDESAAEKKALDMTAGNLSYEGLSETELFGSAVTDSKKVTGVLSGYETGICRLVLGTLNSPMAVTSNGSYMSLTSKRAADIIVQKDRLKIKVYGEIGYDERQNFDRQTLKQQLTDDLKMVVKKLQGYNSDAFGFSGIAKSSCLTMGEWDPAAFKERYKNEEIDVELELGYRFH